jgi:aspartyl-tRNA(Asn)/glutamyl-tRNA(Gln) amidotransferase subunit B
LKNIASTIISGKIAKTVFDEMWKTGEDADVIIERQGLKQISDSGAIEKIVDEVIAANPDQVEQVRAGKTKVMGFLVGQVMKLSKGKANPAEANKILAQKLA